ncbi:MAG: hypothetical protein H6584_02430 [Flavobacteriales bacterium]|nr:hypothetical protein [Flavobacteriales bacterium]
MSKQFCLILLLITGILTPPRANAQFNSDTQAGLYNIGIGSLVGGIGAVINKKPDQKMGKVFLKGFAQGALGGYFVFESKRLVRQFVLTNEYGYVWPSKIVNATGASIIENAASNQNLWEEWHINIGFNRIEVFPEKRFKVAYKIMPFALGNTIYGFTQGRLNIDKSIKTGNFVFKSSGFPLGIAPGNITMISEEELKQYPYSYEEVLSHELIHIYQYEGGLGMSAFFDKPVDKFLKKRKWGSWYQKYVYTDFYYPISGHLVYLDSEYNSSRIIEGEAYYYTWLKDYSPFGPE